MLLCKLLWFLAVSGIAAEHRYVGVENRDSMIVRENASLYWTTSIVYESVERYRISCKKTTVDAARSPRMKDVWFSKTEKQATATPSSKIHPRVEILTPATLSIQRVDLSDEGLYTCEITTAFPAIRKAMNLNVIDLINMVHEATIPSGLDPPFRQVDVQCEAGGYRYRCVASNWVGQDDTAKFEINVYHSPKIIKPFPEDQIVDENGQVSVRCEAEGYPPPKITWIKLLGNQNSQEVNSMNISDVQRSDQGQYRCVASNGVGQDATAKFKINVYHKPVINKTASSQSVYAWPGATRNLSCVADGNPAPQYIWTNSSGIVATSEENGILKVTPQDRDGFGPYTCTVKNNKGKDSLDIQLVRVDKPNVKLKFERGTPFTLTFTLIADDRSTSWQYYTLQYRTDESNGWIKKISKIPPTRRSYNLTDLQPYTEYIVELYGTNIHFTSDSFQVKVRTNAYVPGPPHNVLVDAFNSTAIHVQWMPPLKPNGPLKTYTVLYHETENFVSGSVRKISVMSNVTEAFIGGLDPYTNYTVKVEVENNVATTDSSEVIIRTRQSGYGSEHKIKTDKSSSGPLTRTLLIIVLGLLAGLITMAVLIKFWIGRRHNPPASLRLSPDIDENDFKYDVFITYSRKDCPWVNRELLCLLRENQVKYCVDHEHFELGKVFVQSMVDSVYQSRKVLAVWSENYASSKYCKQELDYAIQRSFQNNDCSVIVIRLDRTGRKRLPKPLRAKTFLDYSDSVERKGWEKRLIRHLKGPDHTNNATETIV